MKTAAPMLQALPRVLAAALVALLFLPEARAQIPLPGSTTAAKEQAPVPVERRSARATIRTFLDSAVAAARDDKPELLEAAVSCLDLSDIHAGTHATAGRDLAIKLKEVIDRIRFVRYEEVPDDPNGPPWVFHSEASIAAEIAIARTASGEWLFTRGTVARIEDLYTHFEGKPKVEGVGGSGLDFSPTLWLRSKMPQELRERGFLLENWQWLGLLALVVLGWLIARAVRFVLHGPVQRMLERREWRVPREMVWRLLEPTGLVATGVVWVIGLNWIGLPSSAQVVAMLIVKFMVAFGVVRGSFRFIDIVTFVLKEKADKTPNRFDDLVVPFFDKTAKVIVVSLGIIFIADVLGISPASLLAGLGIGGLALALAAQDTVKNLFGSLTIVLDRPFQIGDDIKIGADISGTVEEVGFRSTRIRTYENTLITVPNGNLITATVDNLGKRTFFRCRLVLSLQYDTAPAKIHAFTEGLLELAKNHPDTRKDLIRAGLHELTASSLDVVFVCHFAAPDHAANFKARHRLLLGIVTLANRLGVEFAYPTQTLHVVPDDPSRPRPRLLPQTVADLEMAERMGRAEALAISQGEVVVSARESAD
jgi:MscS family membrane protein